MAPLARRPRRRLAATGAALVAAVALSGCASHPVQVPWLGFSVRLPGDPATPQAQAGAPSPAPTPQATAPAVTIQQFIPIARRFVEQHRGLAFKSEVPVTLLDDTAFRQRLLDKTSSARTPSQQLAVVSKELKALHLIDQSVDLGSATDALLGAGVSGFYDPKSKSLVVRGVAATPYVRQVLVHELTHAVQDQWFGIARPALDAANDEQAAAFQAVYEGDAVRIEDEYHNAMTAAEQRQADQESQSQGGGLPAGTPQVLLELLSFPYVVGPEFVRTLSSIGGQARVDAAFTHPPTTTAELIDVQRYLSGGRPRTVAAPKADAATFDDSVLGELGLLLLLERTPGVSSGQALRAGGLWGGDRYAAWDKGSGACVRDSVLADSDADQPLLDQALAAYAAGVSGTTFTPSRNGQPAQLTACG